MTVPSSEADPQRLGWMKAKHVRVGDQVLCVSGWLEVTHSEPTTGGDGSWMLRFAHGVSYYNPRAPVSARGSR